MYFVDTNVFIRYLTNDDPTKAAACFQLFQQAAASQITLHTSEAVIAMVVYVLASKKLYSLDRSEIRTRMYPLLLVSGLQLAQRDVYLRALDLYAAYSIDFEDALIAAHMERQRIVELYSYDTGFDKISGILRIEP